MKALILILAACSLNGAEFPQAEISNGSVNAKLYLPDPASGYYRATRFDWSGVISSLTYSGHEYFGQWFPKYDPKLHDAIMGPVEEFLTDGKGLGYDDAKAGGTFLKIGVGVLRKPQETEFHQFNTYEIVDPGKWSIKKSGDSVRFTQQVKDPTSGYAYRYTKTVRLAKGKPQLILEHTLRNTGSKVIESKAYDHNFFVIDNLPSGPDVSVKFAFAPRATRDLKGAAETSGNEFHYLRELPAGESIYTLFDGYAETPNNYDITVLNSKAGAGVHITGDRPLAQMVLWSIRTTVCPEAYVSMQIEPGKEYAWRMAYDFFTTK